MTNFQKYDLYSQKFKSDPYETYARMRRNDPIFCQPGLDGEMMIWFVTRYDLVTAILNDDRRFVRDVRNALTPEEAADYPPEPPITQMINSHMLNRDGEDHSRLRSLVSQAFTPRMIKQLRKPIEVIANQLLDEIQPVGSADLVEAFAFPLPIIVIAQLLGVPDEDRNKFRVWSDAVVTPDLSEGSLERFVQTMREFTGYLEKLFARRREDSRNDLISALVQAEEQGDKLTEEELFSTVVILIVAGHETTVSLIGNAVYALLQNPEQMALLYDDSELIPAAVEELLRFDGPVERALNRWAAEDVELGGHLIKRTDVVIPIIGAADRDPDRFTNPDTLDIQRNTQGHLAFGRGIHYCLGAPLARLEAAIAIDTLLKRLPNLRLNTNPSKLEWRLVPLFHALTALPVAWDVP